MSDNVNHPSHYNVGKVEVIDAINEWKLDFDLGNVVKYIARAGHKTDDAIEDLEKAQFYLADAIRRRKNAANAKEKGADADGKTECTTGRETFTQEWWLRHDMERRHKG